MRLYTAHIRAGAAPLLVPEGFAWLAALFGWLWLLVHRAWIPAVLNLVAFVLLARLDRVLGSPWPMLGLLLLQGLLARDLWRWSLSRRGYVAGPVIAARSTDEAFARLLTERPDLARQAA